MTFCRFCLIFHQSLEECVWNELNKFTNIIVQDVVKKFMDVSGVSFDVSDFSELPRGSLYSEFGERVIQQFFADDFSNFYSNLQEDRQLENINEYIFMEKFDFLMKETDWSIEGHEAFYKTFAKVIVFTLFAWHRGCKAALYTKGLIREIALKAYNLHFLDPIYDIARKKALGIINALFECMYFNLVYYLSQGELEIGQFNLESSFCTRILSKIDWKLSYFKSRPHFQEMDSEKFRAEVKKYVKILRRERFDNTYQKDFFELAFYIGIISLHSINANFIHGVQVGIDSIVELLISVKCFDSITYPAEGRVRQIQRLNNNLNEFSMILTLLNTNTYP